jgi:hypothetical protein
MNEVKKDILADISNRLNSYLDRSRELVGFRLTRAVEPAQPMAIHSNEEWLEYEARYDSYRDEMESFNSTMEKIESALRSAKSVLHQTIPLDRCWFKVTIADRHKKEHGDDGIRWVSRYEDGELYIKTYPADIKIWLG